MNTKYMEAALQHITNPELLINIVSRRVRQLIQGHRPLTQTDPRMDHMDVALKEIGEGKIGYEIVDATCPMVKEIHTIAREMEKKEYTIIIIGDADHDEVRGIKGQLKTKPILIGPHETIPKATLDAACPDAPTAMGVPQNARMLSAIPSGASFAYRST